MVNLPCQHGLLVRPPPRATFTFGLVTTVAQTSQVAKLLVGEVIGFLLLGTIADRPCLPQTPSSSLLPSSNCTCPTQFRDVVPTSRLCAQPVGSFSELLTVIVEQEGSQSPCYKSRDVFHTLPSHSFALRLLSGHSTRSSSLSEKRQC